MAMSIGLPPYLISIGQYLNELFCSAVFFGTVCDETATFSYDLQLLQISGIIYPIYLKRSLMYPIEKL
jgi:hypothetical protein